MYRIHKSIVCKILAYDVGTLKQPLNRPKNQKTDAAVELSPHNTFHLLTQAFILKLVHKAYYSTIYKRVLATHFNQLETQNSNTMEKK